MTTGARMQAAATAMLSAMPDDDALTLAGAIGMVAGCIARVTQAPVQVMGAVDRLAAGVISGELLT